MQERTTSKRLRDLGLVPEVVLPRVKHDRVIIDLVLRSS